MMKGGIGNMLKQAQQMQANMQKMQEEIANMEVEGQAGGGMVKVTMTGRHDVKRVHIDPSILGDDKEMLEDLIAAAVNDAEMLEDLIAAAVNDAVRHVERLTQERMSSITAGLGLPPGFKLPF